MLLFSISTREFISLVIYLDIQSSITNSNVLLLAKILKCIVNNIDSNDQEEFIHNPVILLKPAREHFVHSIVGYWLLRQSIPENVREQLEKHSQSRIFYKLLQLRTCIELNDLFTEKNINFMWLKGPVLSQQLYNDPFRRDYGDLDCLLHSNDIQVAVDLLELNGYQNLNQQNTDYHLEFLSPDRHVRLEMHTSLAPSEFTSSKIDDVVWEHIQSVCVQDKNLPTLDIEAALVYLLHHGNRHLWYRLQWVMDIVTLLQVAKVDWNVVWKIANDSKQRNSLLLGLHFVKQLFDIQLPVFIDKEIQLRPIISRLGSSLLRHYSVEDDAERMWIYTRVWLYIMESRSERISYLWKLFRERIFVLNHNDIITPLPFLLTWLYYPVRFVRLVYKYFIRSLVR